MLIATAHLYAGLHQHLLDLLGGLKPEDWQRPTVCGKWLVRDVAAHMLDTQMRLLSMGRDGHVPPAPAIASYADLVGFLNGLNHDWVAVMQRVSPTVLLELLRVTGPALSAHIVSLDPHAPALFPVAWAGEQQSENWFDIGRNYTEYWHHQQQIRDAVGAPPLYAREYFHPVLALFVHALRRTYADETEAIVTVEITGDAGGVWTYSSLTGLSIGKHPQPSAVIHMDQDVAWRFFTRGPAAPITAEGDQRLVQKFFGSLAIMG